MGEWSGRTMRDWRGRGRSAAVRHSGRIQNPRQGSPAMGRWVLCALLALLVVGMSYLPFTWVDSCRSFLSYCFQPGAAEGTRLAAWADWQPNSERLTAVWQRLTGNANVSDSALAYPCTGQVSSGYEWRYNAVTGQLEMHYGIDIVSAEGTSVQAARAGVVTEVANDPVLGLYVLIDHGQGVSTKYAHLQSAAVQAGDQVVKGQDIAKVGKTGITKDAHLHFAVLINGQPEDPLPKLQSR